MDQNWHLSEITGKIPAYREVFCRIAPPFNRGLGLSLLSLPSPWQAGMCERLSPGPEQTGLCTSSLHSGFSPAVPLTWVSANTRTRSAYVLHRWAGTKDALQSTKKQVLQGPQHSAAGGCSVHVNLHQRSECVSVKTPRQLLQIILTFSASFWHNQFHFQPQNTNYVHLGWTWGTGIPQGYRRPGPRPP